MTSFRAPAPRAASLAGGRAPAAALSVLLLAAAGVLSVGTAKSTAPAPPPPSTQPPPTVAAPDAGARPAPLPPPTATLRASLAWGRDPTVGGVGSTVGLPALPAQARHLPDGLYHGYLYTAPGARECGDSLPEGVYHRCSVDRGHLLGCGTVALRARSTAYCQGGQYLTCRLDGTGRLARCGAAYSGWTVTEKRGALRRCCIHSGKIKYCTNDADYVCTPSDRRRATPPPLPPRPLPPARTTPPGGYDEPVVNRPVYRPPVRRRGSYQRCDIFNGRVSFCRGWYHGQAVVYKDGAYRSCRVFNGQVSFCGSWYQGEAVAFRDGAYRSCRIFNGQISNCGTWYKGEACVYREE